ncbi:MAG: Uma2 family endonuclease [Polyangiaceae bacterium]
MSHLEALQGQPIRPLRRSEFNQLADLGAFEDERVELLYGQLVPMSPVGAPHCSALERLTELFVVKLVGRMRIRIQMPIAASDESQPQPDLAVAPLSDGKGDHPAHPVLVIEVSHTSLTMDRRVKGKLYAECGVPEYWIVNIPDEVVEVHTSPEAGAYQSCRIFRSGEVVKPSAFPEIEVPVDLLMRD